MDEHKALRVMRTMVDGGQLTDPDSARGKLLQTRGAPVSQQGL